MKPSKLPSGSWRVNAYLGKDIDGKPMRKSVTAKTKKEAMQKALALSANVQVEHMTIREAVERYIESREQSLSPSTIQGYKKALDNQISPISVYMIDGVTNNDLQNWVNSLLRRGYSKKTVYNALGLLKASFKAFNPSMHINVSIGQRERPEILIPTAEEVSSMIGLANNDLKKAIVLGAFCSLRRGEISYLRYSDLKDGILHVHGDMVYSDKLWMRKDVPKTSDSDRYINVPLSAIRILGDGREDEAIYKYTPDDITRGFSRLMKRMGLPYHFHSLRHFYVSQLYAAGVPKTYIQRMGGWSDSHTLDRVYLHLMAQKKDDVSELAMNVFDNIVNQT